MRGLAEYSQVKDHYLFFYGGPNEDYLLELALIRPYLEDKYPGLKLFIGCKDLHFHVIQGYNHTLKESELRGTRLAFGHIRVIESNGEAHPIERLLNENGLQPSLTAPPPPVRTTKCLIIPRGNFPVGPLTQRQKDTLIRIAKAEGYEPEESQDVENAGLVMGVESYSLILAASKGIETRLVPTGTGTRLYRSLFENGKILNI